LGEEEDPETPDARGVDVDSVPPEIPAPASPFIEEESIMPVPTGTLDHAENADTLWLSPDDPLTALFAPGPGEAAVLDDDEEATP
jgi:hypothetical protein